MDWDKGEYEPWVAGWMLGKYAQFTRWPTTGECDDYIDGFCMGCTELGEYDLWLETLKSYVTPATPDCVRQYLK